MKILNPQHNRGQLSEGSRTPQTSHLSQINQQILEKLKEQQQLRMAQKRLVEQEKLYASEPVQTDLVPASQSMKTSDVKHQSQRTLNESKNQLQQSQSHQKFTGLQNSKSNNHTLSQNQSLSGDQDEEEQSPEKDHLLVMTIDLGEGNCDILHIYEYDDPVRKAEAFCIKNGLTKEAMAILAKNIEVNKEIVMTERQHQLYHSTQHLRSTSPQYGYTQTNNYYAQPTAAFPSQQSAIRSNYYRNTQSNTNIVDNSNEQIQLQQSQEQELEYASLPDHQHNPNYYSIPNATSHHNQSTNYHQEQNDDYQVIHPSQKQSIFDRLHGEAACKQQRIEQKKKQQLEQSMHLNSTYRSTKRVIGDTVVNLGDYLYLKGEQLKENKKKNIEEFVLQRKLEQEKELSFKPELDRNSVKMCYNKRMESNEKTEDLLIKQGQIYKEKKDIKKSERENQQLDGCTFKPEVNIMSQFLYEMKKKEQDYPFEGKFDQLHRDHLKRSQRQEERELYTDQCTFHPKINRPPKTIDNIPFVDRMMKSASDKEKKVQELKIKQQLEQQLEDESTFKPQVGRAPLYRNANNLPVHEYLYQKKEEKKIKQEILTKEEIEKQQASKVISLEKSNQIVDNVKKNKLFELFCQLDSDGDGQISSQSIDIQQVPKNVLSIIAPLLCVMEQNNFTFTFDTFYENSMKLISTLTIAQKTELFHNYKGKWDEKRAQYNNFSYAPTINHRSQQLARKRSYEKFEGVYNHGMIATMQKQDKLNHIKQELAQRELDECSFKPQLYKPMNIYSFTDPKNQVNDNNFFGIQNGFDLGDGQFRVTGIVNNAPTVNSIQQ